MKVQKCSTKCRKYHVFQMALNFYSFLFILSSPCHPMSPILIMGNKEGKDHRIAPEEERFWT